MRKYSSTVANYNWEVEYPDNVVFAFNPLYCLLKASTTESLRLMFNVVCGNVTRSINIQMHKGNARIYFSRILQLFFDDYKHFRTLSFSIAVTYNGVTVFSTSLMAIWGVLPLGKRYNAYGLFDFSGKPEFERTRIWFKEFPFTVSMFSINRNPQIKCSFDGKAVEYSSLPPKSSGIPINVDDEWLDSDGNIFRYDASSREYYIVDVGNGGEYGIFEINPARLFPSAVRTASFRIGERGTVNVFDNTFDYTFYQNGLSTHIVNLKICNDRQGYYLRWIDHFGEIQYFLFTNRIETEKNTLSSDSVADMEEVGPMWYPNHIRNAQISSKTTCKCSAVSLPSEIYEYVKTIVTSPIIDLYLGKSASGREIWVPVCIVAASHDYDTTKPLNDLVISFTMPEHKSQTL